MAKVVDGLLVGLQKIYKAVMAGIKKFLTMDFKKIFGVILEAAEIAAEIALAFATGGGSVLLPNHTATTAKNSWFGNELC